MADFVPGSHILFVCNGGIVRSPMAAAVFGAWQSGRMQADAPELAGAGAGASAAGQWGMVNFARNFDLSQRRSRYIGEPGVYSSTTFIIGMDADIVATVRGYSQVDSERLFVLNPPRGVLDPVGSLTLDAYQDSFTQIYNGVTKLIEKLGLNR